MYYYSFLRHQSPPPAQRRFRAAEPPAPHAGRFPICHPPANATAKVFLLPPTSAFTLQPSFILQLSALISDFRPLTSDFISSFIHLPSDIATIVAFVPLRKLS